MRYRVVVLALACLALSGCALVLRASVADDGQAANAPSVTPVLDHDGSVVAFTSEASNLASGDTNGVAGVFVRDIADGSTSLVSADSGGGVADGASSQPDLSADGRFVAFVSEATDLVPGDTNGRADVFVRDRQAGTTERVSIDSGEGQFTWTSGLLACLSPDESDCENTERGVAISDDGSEVAFISRDPATERPAILVRDRSTGTTSAELVSPASGEVATSRYVDVALSGGGSVIAATENTGLRVLDRTTSIASWVSGPSAGGCCSPDLSADGRFLTFTSDVAHTPEDDALGVLDVDAFVFDRVSSSYERVSVRNDGSELDGGASAPSISSDGAVVGWSSADQATEVNPLGNAQLYLRDRTNDETWLASSTSSGIGPADAPVTGRVSGDAAIVALETAATNQAGATPQADSHVFVRLARGPSVTSAPVPVEAGATSVTATITGHGFTGDISVLTGNTEVTIESATRVSDTQVDLVVSSLQGAILAPIDLAITNTGAHGLIAATWCRCLELTFDYAEPTPAVVQPNLVLVNTDDQRWDSMEHLPQMSARNDWATFPNTFVHEPQCCPSRAGTFTGQYAHHNGVTVLKDGEDLDDSVTVATMLHDGGYQTGHFGKYLNGYPWNPTPFTPPGWDRFSAYYGTSPKNLPMLDGGAGAPYFNFYNIEDQAFVGYPRDGASYSTDVYARQARDFIRNADPTKPLFIYLAPITPHFPLVAADRHVGACADEDFPLPPSFNAYDTVGEPSWMTRTSPNDPATEIQKRRATCEMLLAADEAVISIIEELEQAGRMVDANFVFTSDNGYSFGEHRLSGKGQLYDEAVKVPMWAMGTDVVPGTYDRLSSNVDLAPTLVDWAGLTPPAGFFDGTSFADDLDGTNTIPNPDGVLLFGCRTPDAPDECGGVPDWFGHNWGLRTATHKYIEYPDGYVQLFDVAADPYELTNLALDPANAGLLAGLHAQLRAMGGGVTPISGQVTDAETGEPLAGIKVLPFTNGEYLLANTIVTDEDGRYYIFGVPPGSYKLRFDSPDGSHLREYYDDATTLSSANSLTVTDGGAVVADIELTPVGSAVGVVSGTVTDTATSLPLPGIAVRLHDGTAWSAPVTTDASGGYTFTGLVPGQYKVRFDDPAGTYRREFWNDAYTLSSGQYVTVTTEVPGTADVALSPP